VTGAGVEGGGPQRLTERALGALLAAPRAALVLTRSACPPCGAYQAELAALRARGELAGLAVGILVLDRPGAARFKRANPWIRDLRALPYTVLYRRGERVDGFAASRGAYLLERVAAAFGNGAAIRYATQQTGPSRRASPTSGAPS
jgi:hypothetical protein